MFVNGNRSANSSFEDYRGTTVKWVITAAVVVAVIFCVCFFWFSINSGVRRTMREAKDIRIAMKMKAVEQYGLGGVLYQPASRNGMAEGLEETILDMADADGNIVLQAWDSSNNEPAAFTYQKDKYIVIFKQKEDGTAIWDGYYTLKLLEYE
ncbi:MAG: hypothetical protein K6G76_08020 [Lachnospiraceae bacterium]|nr:hypothetical protein [Lachnospiraceae bacterium]